MILIVDDHKDSALGLRRLILRRGYPCRWGGYGAAGLEAIREHPAGEPLLVILDEMMPEMSGREILRTIRAEPAITNTAVVFYTAGYDQTRRLEIMGLGVLAWFVKGGTLAMNVSAIIDEICRLYEQCGGKPISPPVIEG